VEKDESMMTYYDEYCYICHKSWPLTFL